MLRLSALVAAVLAIAGAASAEAGPEPSPERGRELVERHCGGCHATGRSGASREPAAPSLRDLHRRYQPELLAEALAEGLLTGHPMMPEFRFREEDVRSIILYLDSIQTRRSGALGGSPAR